MTNIYNAVIFVVDILNYIVTNNVYNYFVEKVF